MMRTIHAVWRLQNLKEFVSSCTNFSNVLKLWGPSAGAQCSGFPRDNYLRHPLPSSLRPLSLLARNAAPQLPRFRCPICPHTWVRVTAGRA